MRKPFPKSALPDLVDMRTLGVSFPSIGHLDPFGALLDGPTGLSAAVGVALFDGSSGSFDQSDALTASPIGMETWSLLTEQGGMSDKSATDFCPVPGTSALPESCSWVPKSGDAANTTSLVFEFANANIDQDQAGVAHTTADSPNFGNVVASAPSKSESNAARSDAGAIRASSESEITFLTGITSDAKVAATSFWTWNGDRPATYSSTSYAAKWGDPTLFVSGTPGGNVTYFFDINSNWAASEKAALTSGLALWSSVANITFSLASSASSSGFVFYREPNQPGGGSGSAYETATSQTISSSGSGTDGRITHAYIAIDTSVAGFGPIGAAFGTYGGYPYQTVVHEIGHLIGLGHAGSYNGSVDPASQQFSAFDSRLWSIMSYINPWDTSAKYYDSYSVTGTSWGLTGDGYYYEPTTPMILDIAAAQRIYGVASSGTLADGGDIFGFHTNINGPIAPYFDFTINTHPVITIWDGGTNNTLDLSGFSANAVINLAPGTFTSANGETNNIGIALGTTIETAVGGSGNDSIYGTVENNYLYGGRGNDDLHGGGGVDHLYGGAGADVLNGGSGTAYADYSMASVAVVADILSPSTNTGEAAGDIYIAISGLVGSVFSDSLHLGNADGSIWALNGNDELVGGPGNDYLDGGDGVDTVSYARAKSDLVIDFAAAHDNSIGSDTGIDHILNVENVIGGSGNDRIIGIAIDNVLDGGAGDDFLDGGAGRDQLLGGAGNDTIVFDPSDDLAYVLGGVGTDTLEFGSYSAPTTFDLVEQSFECALGLIDHTALNPTSLITRFYDAAWHLQSETGVYDDGASWHGIYDSMGRLDWSGSYHSNGVMSAASDYDLMSQFQWSYYTNKYDSTGELRMQDGTNDDGTTWQYNYNLLGQCEWTGTYYSNHVMSSATAFDTSNQFTWASFTNNYASNAHLLTQDGRNDNSTFWHNIYDSQERIDWAGTFNSDGAMSFASDYDQLDQFIWSSYTNSYAGDGHLAAQSGANDNGTSWYNIYDSQGQLDWRGTYSSSGTVESATDYDQTNQFDWAYYTNRYDATGHLASQNGANDNGSIWNFVF